MVKEKMNTRILRANLLLFTAAVVWGTTFVAQRIGMDYVGPLTYSGVRFAMGSLFLLPFVLRRRNLGAMTPNGTHGKWLPVWGGCLAGAAMAAGINLQQVGLVYTTAGKAGFITGLYVVIVPILMLFWRQRPGLGAWIGASLGAAGLYLMSVTEGFSLAPGDAWVLACAFVWACHVLIVGWLSPKMDSYILAFGQASVCALISLAVAVFTEDITLAGLKAAWLCLLYGGIMSVGVGFTLQVVGQKDSPPAHAAIILQLEAVVAALSGWIILNETMSSRALLGAGLMLAGMLLAQLWALRKQT